MPMQTIQIHGDEFPTAGEAQQHADATGRGDVISVGGKYFVVDRTEAERLEGLGISFALICDDDQGRTFTVPVN